VGIHIIPKLNYPKTPVQEPSLMSVGIRLPDPHTTSKCNSSIDIQHSRKGRRGPIWLDLFLLHPSPVCRYLYLLNPDAIIGYVFILDSNNVPRITHGVKVQLSMDIQHSSKGGVSFGWTLFSFIRLQYSDALFPSWVSGCILAKDGVRIERDETSAAFRDC
jgi:hypothetical protein